MTDGRPRVNIGGREASLALLLALLLVVPLLAAPTGGALPDRAPIDGPSVIPPGFLHRPMVEFFTGLSCPSCMNGPHPETEEMYEAMRDDDSVPWNYVVFHELNGGGVDGLATDETRERMRFYQPGVSGTPCIEVDGGWHTLGGMLGRDSITPTNLQDAIDSATDRYQRKINPLRPFQTIRNDFKFVNLEVAQHLQGEEWVVTVKVSYLGMDRLLLEEDLRGSLYVFMVEDDVNAWSTQEDGDVLNHNVFRGYALEGYEFTMSPGDEQVFAGGWQIPKIGVDPDTEYPQGTPVPVKTMDITAVAAVYDLDDTTSGDSGTGNPTAVPRCIQTATPRSSAYDMDNTAEPVGDVTVTANGNTVAFEAAIDDPDGVASAAVHYSLEGPDSPNWTAMEMGVSGDEVCDDEGVCYAYSNAAASASVDLEDPVDELWYVVTYTDGLGAMGRTEVMHAELNLATSTGAGEGVGRGLLVAMVVVVLLVALGVLMYMTKDKRNRTALAAVMVLVLIVGGVFALSGSGSGGEDAPDIRFTDIDGKASSLSDLQGKVVVLDLMATWCPGCRAEMSNLKEVHKAYGNSIELITVDIDPTETQAQLREFQREYGAEWRFTMDNDAQDFLTKFDVKTIPRIIVIDVYGKVVFAESAEVPADELSDVIDEAATGGRSAISLGGAGTSMGAMLLWASVLGIMTFFSPCSFPLLPGYMTYYLGLRQSQDQRKAILGGISAASGIVLLFLVIAVLVGAFGSAISQYVLYLEPFVGVMLIVMAILIILDININFGLLTYPIKKGMAFSKRTLDRMRGKQVEAGGEAKMVRSIEEGGYVGLFLYGVGYGAAAAGCMAPIVIALILLAAAQGSFLGSVAIFLVFSLAMAALMVVITVALAQGGNAALKRFKVKPQVVKTVSAVLLLIVGAYLVGFFAMGIA